MTHFLDASQILAHRRVSVQDALEVLEQLLVAGAQPRQTQPQARAVLDRLVARRPQRLQQKRPVAAAQRAQGIYRLNHCRADAAQGGSSFQDSRHPMRRCKRCCM